VKSKDADFIRQLGFVSLAIVTATAREEMVTSA